ERALDAHCLFGREKAAIAVDGRLEVNAFLGDLSQRPQAKHLEAAGVGQNRPAPPHKAMEPTVCADDIEPWAQPKMESVGQDDLGTEIDEVGRRKSLHGAIGADRHESGSLHRSM